MPYNVTRSNGSVQTIQDNVLDNLKYSVTIPGRAVYNYGQSYANAIVNILENFANTTPPARAVPGQLWYNTTTKILNVNQSTNDTTPVWESVGFLGEEGNPVPAIFVTQLGSATTQVANIYATQIGTAANRVSTIFATTIGSASAPVTNVYGGVFNGTATQARYADLAERYHADAVYTAGTVLSIGGVKEVTIASEIDKVFSVVSKDPGYLMNSTAGDDSTHPPVVLHGRSPVRVIGKIKKGDYLELSNVPGVAQAGTKESSFARALEDNNTESEKLVLAYIVAGK